MAPIIKLVFITAFIFSFSIAKATTWDEPWHNEVVKKADYFVLAKVIGNDSQKWVRIIILKQFGGKHLRDTITITNFYLLSLCSYSSGEGPDFSFKNVDSCYFLIKTNAKNEYCIATPTAGYAILRYGKVHATYRHSYHQALVDPLIYENTMSAIFNNYHGLPYDKAYINNFVDKYLSLKPAGLGDSEIETFFNQHVALECVYHLRLPNYYSKIISFLLDSSANFHSQISAARALIAYNTAESKQMLLKKIRDKKTIDFVKVMCIWTLADFKPKELKADLAKIEVTASEKENGFGGDIMDPRVCTSLPTVKGAIKDLVAKLN